MLAPMLYLGSYSGGGAAGIGVLTVGDGAPALGRAAACAPDPSYLAMAPGGRVLYAVHELQDGLVSAFAVDPAGTLRGLGTRSSGGSAPCHVSVHPGGRYLLTANHGSGSVAVHPIAGDGALGPPSDVVDGGPRAHMVVADPAARWVLAIRLGAGTVTTYRLDDRSGRLHVEREARLHRGAGPRHLAFHPSGTAAFVVNELDSTVTACAYDPATGALDPRTTVRTVPDGTAAENYPSAILVAPDGRFVYVANRGHDSVAVLATEPDLRLVAAAPCGGEYPRDLALDPGGRRLYAANQRSGTVTCMAVDPAGGGVAEPAWRLPIPAPTCLLPA
jgi:6-phosphogluconolactonase